jgi:biotin synthase-like enzyme
MIQGVKAMGMETCVTLGMLTPAQAFTLKEAGLDYYNHATQHPYKSVLHPYLWLLVLA